MDLRFDLLTDLQSVTELSPDWERLLCRSSCNRGFSSCYWYRTALEVAPELTPCLVVGWRGSTLAAVGPLAVDGSGTALFPASMSNYNDLVVARGDHHAAEQMMTYLTSPGKPYRRLELRWLREDGNAAIAHGWRPERDYHYIDLAGGNAAEYLQNRSSSFRKGLNRVLRKAAADGLTVRQLDPSTLEPARLPQLFLDLHLQRFGERSAFGERNRRFAESVLPALFEAGHLTVFVVERDSKILAIDLSLFGENSLCTWNGGYPEEAEPWSPGKLLLWAGIERACELGFAEYDLLRGEQEWKGHWSNRQRRVGRIVWPS